MLLSKFKRVVRVNMTVKQKKKYIIISDGFVRATLLFCLERTFMRTALVPLTSELQKNRLPLVRYA